MQKAVIYGQNELCDLAAAEAAGVDKEHIELEHMIALLKAGGGGSDINATQVKQMDASVRALTHGITAYCYKQRDEHEKAVAELDATLRALEDSGVAPGEIALLRAYVSMEQGDPAAARKHLETARDYAGTDADTKKDVEAILGELKDDPNIFEAKLGKAFFTVYLTKIILRNLDKAGVFDELKETELFKTLDGFVSAMTETMNNAKSSGAGVVDSLKGLVSDD
jgi:tetratricopeptide (TPR) repeat protein